MLSYIIGIDEVGRGPLAGPVAVGAVLVPVDFDWSQLAGVADSKKLTPEKREAIYVKSLSLQREGKLRSKVTFASAHTIDAIGIVSAINKCLVRSLSLVMKESVFDSCNELTVNILLDGGLRAPIGYKNQQTIIKGDAKELVIGLASIMAKVERDRKMRVVATSHPQYAFEEHKGYGTQRHRKAISLYGISSVHRRSFCKNIIPSN